MLFLSALFICQAVQHSDSAAYAPGSPVIFSTSWWTAAFHSNKPINKTSKNTQGIAKIAEVAVCMVW
jgi:hypothetical protein